MFAVSVVEGWPDTGPPLVACVGAKRVPSGVLVYLAAFAPNNYNRESFALRLYDADGQEAATELVRWEGWNDEEREGVLFEYATQEEHSGESET